MFSQAGGAWSRAVVREVPPDLASWDTLSVDTLPGAPFPLKPAGVDNKDLSNFVSKTERWDAERVHGLRSLFRRHLSPGRALLVMRVNGRLSAGDAVTMAFVPYVYLRPDTSLVHPALDTSPDPGRLATDGGARRPAR
jgi:hypothetical protein